MQHHRTQLLIQTKGGDLKRTFMWFYDEWRTSVTSVLISSGRGETISYHFKWEEGGDPSRRLAHLTACCSRGKAPEAPIGFPPSGGWHLRTTQTIRSDTKQNLGEPKSCRKQTDIFILFAVRSQGTDVPPHLDLFWFHLVPDGIDHLSTRWPPSVALVKTTFLDPLTTL